MQSSSNNDMVNAALPALDPNLKVAVLGLGYVGLPLVCALAENYIVVGFDIDRQRIHDLENGLDSSGQITDLELKSKEIEFCSVAASISDCKVYIITVPTPVNSDKKPDLSALLDASRIVGEYLQMGDVVIYESTVYPGCTEEDCVPVLEAASGLQYNRDFFCGYSPERVSPGDSSRTLKKIVKVTAGSDEGTARFVDDFYRSIIDAGTYKATSIKVAEASKAIENAQRDINISFVNEMALIFDRLGIDTSDVLDAARTKWNFLDFKPGLVGGHCIGVDPYYLAFKAEQIGYKPRVISSGREVNDEMPHFILAKIRAFLPRLSVEKQLRALVLGFSFKGNCPDIRNTKVFDIVKGLRDICSNVDVYDPVVSSDDALEQYSLMLISDVHATRYDVIVFAVAHDIFRDINFSSLTDENTIVYDATSTLPRHMINARL